MKCNLNKMVVSCLFVTGVYGCGDGAWDRAVETEPDDLQCSSTAVGSIALSVNAPSTPVSETIEVTGTARHKRHMVIDNVFIGDIPAESTSPNFATWKATIPLRTLEEEYSAEAGNGREVTLQVTAIDICGDASSEQSLALELDGSITGTLNRIALLPEEATLTTSKGNGAVMTVVTNPEAAGLTAKFGCDGCFFIRPGEEQPNPSTVTQTLVLDGDDAAASVYVASETQGTAVMTVQVGERFKAAVLTVEEPSE